MTLIIAEAGVNHNGDINLAHELIKAAQYAVQPLLESEKTTETEIRDVPDRKLKHQESYVGVEDLPISEGGYKKRKNRHKKLIPVCFS